MPKDVTILAQAFDEAQAAYQWYEQRGPKAAERFEKEFDLAIASIAEHPQRWPEYLHNTRFYQLGSFPFVVVHRETDNAIEILAVAHTHRR